MTTSTTEHGGSGWVLFGAFVCGALTGATVAILLDPERGREIREQIAAKAREGRKQASKVFDHATQAISEGRAAVAEIRERGEQAAHTIRQEAAEAVADARTAFRRARTEAARES